jgi:HlyD family secretion protein
MSEKDVDTSVLTKEIIGTTPSWIIQWGITLIFLVFIGVGLALTLIKYPVSRHLDALVTYETQPLAITVPENSMLTAVYINDTGSVTRDQAVMALENESAQQYLLKAPVTGRLYLTDRWQPNAFVHTGQILGFILPAADERILRLKMNAADMVHLQKGRKVVIGVDRPPGIDRPLPGYIDFIGPAFRNQGYYSVNIKLRSSEQAYLSSLPFLSAVDSLHCHVSITIDTTTCLHYFFSRR